MKFRSLPLFIAGIGIAFGMSARAGGFFENFFAGRHDSQLIKNALVDHDIQDGRAYTIHTDSRVTCTNNPPSYTDASVNYWISRKNSEIMIDLPIMFTYQGKPENHDTVLNRLPGLEACVTHFYELNGLKLSLRLTEGDENAARAYGYSYVNIWDEYDRDNAANWSTLADIHGEASDRQVCARWAHEVGHLLGLPDRYYDPACPDRPGIEHSNDIMAKVSANPSNQTISEEDMAIILRPFSEN